uniref:Uncharacterized protein n=1 Tax=Amphimedon queenslandica TaxID=400682 RepID=A0A1X7UDV6_AMPQE
MAKQNEDEKEDSRKHGSYTHRKKRNSKKVNTIAKKEVAIADNIGVMKAGNKSNKILENSRYGDHVTGEVTAAEEDVININLISQE